ncbi:MAG: UDP-N-acetylmuramoyl-tripeptide--D-alanyl-D-alanine ligase [Candidatus Binatus sp.]|jgi:UDP-N-acetylmuramoyl-tripeptide--D-alanyl-D-alanine ligase|uniref:UDP-N-acetylmuramoyl-tripeptide--D-alanyl-D- alanine ligase n=1 Tax=Candidatus Binatus sp. TaxID=2811406 RepID=UPI003CBC5366
MATPIPSNQCEFTLAEVVEATGGTLVRAASTVPAGGGVRGVSIDTRSIGAGAIFVAIRGALSDGHDYLPQAAARGAAAAIVATGRRHPALDCIEVADTLAALGRLARRHLMRTRAARPLPLIAIGGAVGKTTTKELTAAAARALFGATLSTPGNLNNLIGVPMTIFTLTGEDRAAVLECGTNTRGEIPKLAQIVEPDVAMVLNADLEHSEGLGTLEDIANEEAALFSTAGRYAVASADEPMVLARIPKHLRRITFGKSADADVRLVSRSVGVRSRIRVEIARAMLAAGVEPFIETKIALLGEAAALNCTAAIAGVAAMRPLPLESRELAAIADALAAVKPVAGRLANSSIHGIFVIDDTYNSNPRSIRAALAAAREVADGLGARLVIALGDMLELGELSAGAHQEAIRDVMRSRPAAFVAVGPEMNSACAAVSSDADTTEVLAAPDSIAAAGMIAGLLRPGDVLLVKGSRGIAMERVLEKLG